MKRYSPILFIWLVCLICVSFIAHKTYINGEVSESLAWGTAMAFLSNLIVYHFYATRNEKKKDKKILGE